jgi:hypothetical protein
MRQPGKVRLRDRLKPDERKQRVAENNGRLDIWAFAFPHARRVAPHRELAAGLTLREVASLTSATASPRVICVIALPREQAGSLPPPAVTHRFPRSRRGDVAQGGSGHNAVSECSPRVHPEPDARNPRATVTPDATIRARIDMTFTELGLNARMVSRLDALGLTATDSHPAKAIPHALQGRDILGIAQTGTGKTAAFGIPLVVALSKAQEKAAPKAARGLDPRADPGTGQSDRPEPSAR